MSHAPKLLKVTLRLTEAEIKRLWMFAQGTLDAGSENEELNALLEKVKEALYEAK